jgi:hypothetical protein
VTAPRLHRLLLPALGVAAVLACAAVPAAQALEGPGVIRITERHVSSAYLDLGRHGHGIGDEQILRVGLYNTRITPKAIGTGQLVCIYTSATARQCSGTYALPQGKLVVAGSLLYTEFFQLAVVGGTGYYDGVRGTLTVTLLHRNPRLVDLVLFRIFG